MAPTRWLLSPVLASLLAGCAQPSGVWVLFFPYQEDGATCTETLTENFVDAYVPEADAPTGTDWTTTELYEGGDALAFAQIETTAAGEAVLVFGGLAYPGVKGEKGTWIFEWSDDSATSEETTHASGYRYTESTVAQSSTKFVFTPEGLDGGKASGTVKLDSTGTTTYTESDTWNDDVYEEIGGYGQISFVSSAYLVYEDGQGNEWEQANEYDVEECDGDCSIGIATACSGSSTFTATRSDYADEEAFSYLQDVGNGG